MKQCLLYPCFFENAAQHVVDYNKGVTHIYLILVHVVVQIRTDALQTFSKVILKFVNQVMGCKPCFKYKRFKTMRGYFFPEKNIIVFIVTLKVVKVTRRKTCSSEEVKALVCFFPSSLLAYQPFQRGQTGDCNLIWQSYN